MLPSLPGISFMPEAHGRATRWLTCIVVDEAAFGASREAVRLALIAKDIEARPVWKPMHLQPVFTAGPHQARVVGGAASEDLFARGLCLPSGSNLTDAEIDEIIDVVRACRR